MATIPTGNFGNSIAQPRQAARVSPDAFGAAQGRALADAGQQGQQVAIDQLQKETRQQQQIVAREAQTNAARVRITKTNDLADANEQLDRDIMAGAVPKDKADEEWAYRSKQILENATSGVSPEYAGALQVEFEGLQRRGSNSIRDTVFKKDLDDTRANIESTAEQYQRLATRDRPRAVAEFSAILDAASNLPEAERTKIKQNFKEQTAYTNAFSLVRASSQDLNAVQAARKALDSNQFADIDPQKRAVLDAQLDGYQTNILQRQEIAAQRAERRAEAHLNRARAAFEASQARVDAGIPDSPDQIAATAQALSGTPFLDTYKLQQQQARALGGAAARPISTQQAQLDAINTRIVQGGTSDALIKQRDTLQKALDAAKNDIKNDALRAGLERGVITALPAVDMSSIDGLTRSLGERLVTAQQVQTWAQQPVSPFTSDEAQRISTLISALPPQQRSTALATLGTTIGPQASAGLAAQIDQKDKGLALALQFGASKTTTGRYTSELILKGQQAIKDKAVKVDAVAENGWRGQIAKEVGDAYTNERQAADVKEAAYLITAGLAAEGIVDPKQAVRLAAGGRIVDFNGRKVPVPGGISEAQFTDRMRSLTPENFAAQAPGGKVRAGGVQIPLADFVKTLPDAQLVYAGRGRYNVLAGPRVVTNDQGSPIVITAGP